jgi:tetratricopeptide (TPR) repeat protein
MLLSSLPSVPTTNSGKEKEGYIFPTAGSADNFLKFLETELIPMLDNRYRTAPHRGIVGWSFSGLFSAYAAVTKPDLFNMYLCISPAVWWDNDLIYKKIEDVSFEHPENFVFTLGDGEEGGWVHSSTTRLLKRLEDNPTPNVTVKHIAIPKVGHSWTISSAINLGLQALYSNYIPQNDTIIKNLDDIKSYYEELSNQWGYDVTPPGKIFRSLAWYLWGNEKKEQAIKVLRASIAYNSNDSPSIYALGYMLDEQKNLSEALIYYRKALKVEMMKSVPNGINLRTYEEVIAISEKKMAK